MPDKIKEQLQALLDRWSKLGSRQKQILLGGIVGGSVIVVLILLWASRPDFGVLYSSLAPDEAGAVVEYLQGENIEYQLTAGGGTIMVPRRQLYEARIQIAGKGIVSGGVKGYELLDEQNTLGQSERYQKLAQKRALEGELARTISSLRTVKRAYVKIVLPEPSLFSDKQLESTAAVTLELAGRDYLDRSQIDGITRMVASSVEGLRPADVTVIDTYGNILSESMNDDTPLGISSMQMKMKHMVDDYYTRRAQLMLDRVLGNERSVVQVAAELNFAQIEKTTESYDPDTQIIRSEERLENSETTPDTSQVASESSVSNYEVNRSVEHLISQTGNITRLSVSLAVDGSWEPAPEGEGEELQYIPRTSVELEALTEIVKGAVGFDTKRQDQITVRSVPFNHTLQQQEEGLYVRFQDALLYSDLLKKGLLIAGVVMLFLLLRSALKGTRQVLSERLAGATADAQPADFSLTSVTGSSLPVEQMVLPEEEKQFRQLQDQVLKFTETNPEDAIRLLRTWYVNTEQS
ncbi:MAG: flagellar M-ring protein FliF [Candidatus Delongbacteria bacterium]|nr:flagellar M-ring protein FliF [Candidatus Delongbacteria bacterium]